MLEGPAAHRQNGASQPGRPTCQHWLAGSESALLLEEKQFGSPAEPG